VTFFVISDSSAEMGLEGEWDEKLRMAHLTGTASWATNNSR